MKNRGLYENLWQELARDKSMIFLAGPRQAGKTTLANIISGSFTNSLYFNWDIPEHRTRLIEKPVFFEEVERRDFSSPLIIFDEIHKFKDWKNYLKGVYDQFHDKYKFLVSGSGRLDIYQKGGDSLAGRYFLFHLWPFTIAELARRNRSIEEFLKDPFLIDSAIDEELKATWERLGSMSGFPEPFLANRPATYRRWSNGYAQQLIREDIRDLAAIKSVSDIETLYHLLPSKVGSPLSIPSLARDLKVAYNTVQNWLSVFERFFLTFSLSPWTAKISRAIQKERKVYIWDAPRVRNQAALFENMVAIELKRAVSSWNDAGHGSFALHYIKNKEQQEVDFLVSNNNEPVFMVEAKLSETEPSAALKKFQKMLRIPAVQLTAGSLTGGTDSFRLLTNDSNALLVAPAYIWLSGLP